MNMRFYINRLMLICGIFMGINNLVLADAGGHFILPELNGAITIEDEDASAVCVSSDWPAGLGESLDVTILPISAGPNGSGRLLIHHPDDPIVDDEIYVFFNIDDNTSNISVNIDNLVLMLDLSHDHAVANTSSFTDSDDRGIRFNRSGTVERVFGNITSVTVDSDATVFPDNRACVSEAGAMGWAMEARIIPSDFGLSNFNGLIGAAVLVDDRNGGASNLSRWPSTVVADPNTWANMVTRPPIDFALLIDQSGSMSGDKWTSAKQAGNNLQALLATLHDSVLSSEFSTLGVSGGGDRLGLATFSTSLSGNAHVNRSFQSIDATAQDFTGVLPNTPGGGTPMADGINETFDMFGGAANLGASDLTNPKVVRQKVVMMLSDGKHNSPNSTMDFDAQGVDFDYLAVTPNCDSNASVNSLVRVNAVAVGTDSTVDTGKLDDIKSCFSGSRMTNIYNIAGADEPELTATLSRFYFETLYPYYHLNMINDSGADFELKAGERKLIIFAFWADTGAVTSLAITKPDTSVENGTCPAGLGYCYIILNNPAEGSYTNYSAPGAVGDGRFALLDLRVEARFALDNQPHGTNSTITLRGRLQDDGKPVLGADVKVDIFKPEEGFGTFAATHSLDTCTSITPQLPAFDIVNRDDSSVHGYGKSSVIFSSANLNIKPTTVNGDINPPAYSLMEALFAACNKEQLKRAKDSALKMYDDGSHGDASANDGIYTLSFNNTDIEGSYVFRFSAVGNMSNGKPFHRLKEIGEYVKLDIDLNNSDTQIRLLQGEGNLVIEEYSVTPRDAKGEYLGPGHSGQIKFLVSGAVKDGTVMDYNNGIYAQLLRYDRTSPTKPTVVIIVQGVPITPECRDCQSGDGIPMWFWMLLLIILLIIFYILFKCFRVCKDKR